MTGKRSDWVKTITTISILITMKKRKNKKNKEKLQKPRKDISELIDELAYINEGENILNSKKFLDGLYMLEHE